MFCFILLKVFISSTTFPSLSPDSRCLHSIHLLFSLNSITTTIFQFPLSSSIIYLPFPVLSTSLHTHSDHLNKSTLFRLFLIHLLPLYLYLLLFRILKFLCTFTFISRIGTSGSKEEYNGITTIQ